MLLRSMRYPFAATRARALAAGFIRHADFEELSRLRSLEEALSRLQEETTFHPGFYRTGEGLSEDFLDFGHRISRTLPTNDRSLVEGYLGRVDVENLKIVSRGLLMNRPREEFHPLLMTGGPATFLSPDRLRAAGTLEELAGSLPRHPFRVVLRETLEMPAEERLFHLETGLDGEFWIGIEKQLNRLSPLDRLGAKDILALRADIDRFNVIHRGLQAGLKEEIILNALPSIGTIYPRSRVRKALRSASPAETLAGMFPLHKVSKPFSSEGEVALRRRLARFLERVLRSHPFDISVPLASLLLKEMEIQNLEAVLNGLRMKRSDRIAAFLATGKG
jgi:vacuolar-type H+-ATPase subunit C/Vma6